MPRVDFENLPLTGAESWAKYYDSGDEGYGLWLQPAKDALRLHLTDGPLFVNRLEQIPHPFSFNSTDRILIAGSGGGYLIQAFRDAGYPNCWGIDYSTALDGSTGVMAAVAQDGTAWIDLGAPGGQVRAALRNVTGDDEFHWVITEDVAPCYDLDAELDGLLGAAQNVLSPGIGNEQVINVVTVLRQDGIFQDPDFLWLFLDDWNAFRPAQSWVSTGSYEVR